MLHYFGHIEIMYFGVAALSKARVCDSSLARIVGSNSAGGMDVSPLWVSMLSGRGLYFG